MMQTLREKIATLLNPEVPLRLRLAHGVDVDNPLHLEAVEAISGRKALYIIETYSQEKILSGSRIDPKEAEWLSGCSEPLLFWSKSARRRPTWDLSIALEMRDYLWTEGYQLSPGDKWTKAIEQSLIHLGYAPDLDKIKQGQKVYSLTTNLRIPSHMHLAHINLSEAGSLVLRALHKKGPTYTVTSIESKGPKGKVWVQRDDALELPECKPRTSLWPIGCSTTKEIRENFIKYDEDALEATVGWANSYTVSINEFCEEERKRMRKTKELWECKD